MNDSITITLDGAEAHVVAAALASYRKMLDRAGPDLSVLLDRIALRAEHKLADEMYGGADLALGDHYLYPVPDRMMGQW